MSTISKLATDTILAKSYYAGRTHPIDGIIIHHMGSIQTARSCASSFNALPYSASSNYCVGNAGDICCSVPEENAAITSNSYEYDNRSITIEISNSARNGQWPVGDKAMEATLQLLVDICQRYPRIGRLNFTGDKTGNLRYHSMFAYTICPGEYLKSKMSWIAEEVNRRLDVAEGKKEKKEEEEDKMTEIMGKSVATLEQMRTRLLKANPNVAQSVLDMLPYYLSEGEAEGVRGDVAFAQSCIETGNFAFPQTTCNVTLDQNNFAMIGVTGTWAKGNSFATPQLGIRAQIQHLKAYACKDPLHGACVDPRFSLVQRGCAPYVEWLGTQENPQGKGWAGAKGYGDKILRVLAEILAVETTQKPENKPVSEETTYTVLVDGLAEKYAKDLVAELEADGYKPTMAADKAEKEEPAESPLALLDLVKMQQGAPVWGLGRQFQSWVYTKTLYVRAIDGDRVTVSIYKSGAVTGDVDRKYLDKV